MYVKLLEIVLLAVNHDGGSWKSPHFKFICAPIFISVLIR